MPVIKSKRSKILVCVLVINIILISIIAIIQKRKDTGVTYAQAAKLFAYGMAQESYIDTLEQNNMGYWYKPYVDIIKEQFDITISTKLADKAVSWEFVYNIYSKLKDNEYKYVDKPEIIRCLEKNADNSNKIDKEQFYAVYLELIIYMPYSDGITMTETAIAGTPLMLGKAGEWEVYTTGGRFRFNGLILDDKIDKTVSMIVKNNEILSVIDVTSNHAQYKNIWVKSCVDNVLETNIYGADRTFYIKGVSQNINSVLADINLTGGKVTQINIKTDEVAGKVLAVTADYIEIEGYGKIPLDKDFMIYDINNGFSVKTYEDIVVGYSLQNFIVAQGSICGAVISRPLNVDNIRVIIKNTGFSDIFHDNVVLECDGAYTVSYGDEQLVCNPGQQTVITRDNPAFASGRITVHTDYSDGIRVASVTRGYGMPEYKGTLELSLYEQGIVMVNDIDIENYLKRVVPSEMPVGFGVEALKVQAVCARSYAYRQLTNSCYSEYGAHVDDSTQFQVYNNTNESEVADRAISDTAGAVLKYNSEVVQTYYYSTSCGVTTDVGLWGSDPSGYPYFSSVTVGRTKKSADLKNEETFEQFITTRDESDYDYNCALYRWELTISREELSKSFNSKLYERYMAVPGKILTQNEAGEFVSQKISTVGNIQDIIVNSRADGGAATSVTVLGDAANVRIDSESCIRVLFGYDSIEMKTNTGTTVMSSLPSTFCIFRKYNNTDGSSGFVITGGGYGHGIGMSQNAVCSMVNDGMSYVQILQFFYPGTKVEVGV